MWTIYIYIYIYNIFIYAYIYMTCNGLLTFATKTNPLRLKPPDRKFSNPAQNFFNCPPTFPTRTHLKQWYGELFPVIGKIYFFNRCIF